jgi:RNA polymerase sigma-70 factor (ECF subfamily)
MPAADVLLVLRAQQGDREALDGVLRQVQGPLFRFIRSLVVDTSAADDVLQEALLRIARKLRWLEEPRHFRAWAFRVAAREAYRYFARRRVDISLDDAAVEMLATEPEVWTRDEVERARAAVTELSPASRAVIVLHYFEELPLREVADVLEIQPGTVKSRLAYGLACLRRSLKEQP